MSAQKDIASTLRWLRENPQGQDGQTTKLTQSELASRLGISTSLISQTESSTGDHARNISVERIEAWASACGYVLDLRVLPADTGGEERLIHTLRCRPPQLKRIVSRLLDLSDKLSAEQLDELEWLLGAWQQRGDGWREQLAQHGPALHIEE